MQKVVGSNPISRFASNPLHVGHSALRGKIKPPPHIPSILGTSSQNDADARGLAAISADPASLSPGGGARFASAKT
jgi:hypothetical protein